MKKLALIAFLVFNICLSQGKNDNGYIFGKILYNQELQIPVHGVRIDSDKSNAKDTDINGQFTLFFPNSNAPDKVQITIGNQIDDESIIEDINGNVYALVSPTPNELINYRIPTEPTLDSLNIYVLPAGQLALDLKTVNYNLQEYIQQLIERSEQDRLKIERLLKLQPNNEKLKNEVNQLSQDIEQNEAYLIKGLSAKEAYNLLLKQTENANSRLVQFLEALKKDETIDSAIRFLNPLKAYEESSINLDFAIKGIEEIKTYINTLSKNYDKRNKVFEAYDLITKIYKENSVLIFDKNRNYLIENLESQRNFLLSNNELNELYDDLYFNHVSRFTDLVYAEQIESLYESLLELDQNNQYSTDYTFIWYLARACGAQRKYNKAIKYSLQALNIQDNTVSQGLIESDFPEIKSHKVILNVQDFWRDYARLNNQIGVLQVESGNLEKAKKRFEKSVKLLGDDPYEIFRSIQILDLITVHLLSGDIKKARQLFYELYKYTEKEHDYMEIYFDFYHKQRQHQHKNLDEIYKRFINLNQSIENKKGKVTYYSDLEPLLYTRIADVYRDKNDLEKADEYYKISNQKYNSDLTKTVVKNDINARAQIHILESWAKNTVKSARMWANIEEFDKSKSSYNTYITVLEKLSALDKDSYPPHDLIREILNRLYYAESFTTWSTEYIIPKKIGLQMVNIAQQKLPIADISEDRFISYSIRLKDYKKYFEQFNIETYLKKYHYNKFYYETLSKENDLNEFLNELTYDEAMVRINDIIDGYESYLSKYNNAKILKNYSRFYFDVCAAYLTSKNTNYKLSADIGLRGYKQFPEDPFLIVYAAFAYLLNGDIDKAISLYRDYQNTPIELEGHKILKSLFLEELIRLQKIDEFNQLHKGGKYYQGFLRAKKVLGS